MKTRPQGSEATLLLPRYNSQGRLPAWGRVRNLLLNPIRRRSPSFARLGQAPNGTWSGRPKRGPLARRLRS